MQGPSTNSTGADDYIVIGKITRPHGIRGALRVEPYTQDSDKFLSLESLYLAGAGDRKLFQVEKVQSAGKQIILTLTGISSRNEAELYRNFSLEITRQDAQDMDDDGFYYDELIGFKVVTVENLEIGILDDIMQNPANDIFVIRKDDKELLIPVVDEFVSNIDKHKGVITIDPIEGLLEYN